MRSGMEGGHLNPVKTNREKENYNPDESDIHVSPFVSEALAFTVGRKRKLLEKVASKICSVDDVGLQYDGTQQLADLITTDHRLCDYIDSPVLDHLVGFLDNLDDTKKNILGDKKLKNIQYYSNIVLTVVTCSKKGTVIKDRAISAVLCVIPHAHMIGQVQALWVLLNLCSISESSDTIIREGGLEVLETILIERSNPNEVLRLATELLAALCRMKPAQLFDKIEVVLRILGKIIKYEMISVIVPSCMAITYLSDDRYVPIGGEVLVRLLSLIDYPLPEIVINALKSLGNCVRWGDDDLINDLIRDGLLETFKELIFHKYTMVRKEVCWILSNIAVTHIKPVVDSSVVNSLIRVFESDEFEVMEVAASVISNLVYGSDKEQLKYVIAVCSENLKKTKSSSDDSRIGTLWSQLLDKIIYRADVLNCLETVEEKLTSSAPTSSTSQSSRKKKVRKSKGQRRRFT